MYDHVNTLGLLLLAWALGVCSLDSSVYSQPKVSQPIVREQSAEEPMFEEGGMAMVEYDGETSLEERIVKYPVVVRAVVDSVTSDIIATSGFETGKYAVVLKVNLTVREYLNGLGSNRITGIWPAFPSYDSRTEAEADRASLVAGRSAPYDDREAIFFLTDDFWIYDAADDDDTYYLDDTKGFAGSWNGTIDVRAKLNRLWLPTNNVGTRDNREYVLALPGSNLAGFEQSVVSSTSTITLAALKSRIAAVNTELNKAGDPEERRECLQNRYKLERRRHYKKVEFGHEPLKTRNTEHSITSGAPAGTLIFEEWGLAPSSDDKPKTAWIEGDASSLFEMADGASLPGDQNSVISGPKGSIVYPRQLTNARPLPSGSYSITVKEQLRSPVAQLCFEVDSFDWTVTVTAQSETTHEFFFDPVTVGSAVAADGSNGVLKPTSFTDTDGAPATVESISYEPLSPGSEPAPGSNRGQAGKVKVKIVPWDALSGVVDVIELDGTVSASLRVANSSVDLGSDTVTWSVPSQPWHDGDMLMVRIRRAAPFASAPHGLMSTNVGRDSISLSWDSVNGVTGYVVERRVSGAPGWETLDTKVTGKSYTASGLSCGTSYEFRVGAYGDRTRSERVPGPVSYATLSETTDECSAQ